MKRTITLLLTSLSISSLIAFVSCNKENQSVSSQFVATMENYYDELGKTALNGTSLNWENDDQISIYGVGGDGIYSATPGIPPTTATFSQMSGSPVMAPCRAYYPATITTDGNTITLPSTQISDDGNLVGLPMYAESNNNTLEFKNLCGALKLHLTKANISVSSIIITADAYISGNYTIDYNNGEPTLTYANKGVNHVTLTCSTPQPIGNGHDFYVVMPAGTYNELVIDIHTTDGTHCIKTANVAIPVIRSQYTPISFDENDMDFETFITFDHYWTTQRRFSVSENQQVIFANGNLQYQPSTHSWRFADNMYDIIGIGNNNASATYDGWIDLFSWGTGYNPVQHISSTRDSDFPIFVDWGVRTGYYWQTLSSEEWNYIFNQRPNAAEKWGIGVVNGIKGLILLPDDWELPSGYSFTPGNSGTANNYTITQWGIMQHDGGAVFLPIGGMRLGRQGVYSVEYEGCYWTSDLNPKTLHFIILQDGLQALWTNHTELKYVGSSVRLAHYAEF